MAPLRRCVFEPCAAPWPCEVVLLHHALEAFALRLADHIDPIARLKLRDAQVDLAFRRIRLRDEIPARISSARNRLS